MHIARKELRAFPPDSPEHIVLHAMKQLRTHGKPDWQRFLSAAHTLIDHRAAYGLMTNLDERSKKLRELGVGVRKIVQKETGGALYDALYRIINEFGFEEAYIRTFESPPMGHLPKAIRSAFTTLFPCKADVIFVITAWDTRGERRILY